MRLSKLTKEILLYSTKRRQLHHRYDGHPTDYDSTYLVELRRVWSISWRRSSRCHGSSAVPASPGRSQISYCALSDPPLSTLLWTGSLRTQSVACSSVY